MALANAASPHANNVLSLRLGLTQAKEQQLNQRSNKELHSALALCLSPALHNTPALANCADTTAARFYIYPIVSCEGPLRTRTKLPSHGRLHL